MYFLKTSCNVFWMVLFDILVSSAKSCLVQQTPSNFHAMYIQETEINFANLFSVICGPTIFLIQGRKSLEYLQTLPIFCKFFPDDQSQLQRLSLYFVANLKLFCNFLHAICKMGNWSVVARFWMDLQYSLKLHQKYVVRFSCLSFLDALQTLQTI